MKNKDQNLSRSLQSRHIQMIAIGGAIGTGLFLGSGSAIHTSGPSIILAYLIVGLFCFFMMRAIGELLMSDTSKHSFWTSLVSIWVIGWNSSLAGCTGSAGLVWLWRI